MLQEVLDDADTKNRIVWSGCPKNVKLAQESRFVVEVLARIILHSPVSMYLLLRRHKIPIAKAIAIGKYLAGPWKGLKRFGLLASQKTDGLCYLIADVSDVHPGVGI